MNIFALIFIAAAIAWGVVILAVWFKWRIKAYRHRSYIASLNDGGSWARKL